MKGLTSNLFEYLIKGTFVNYVTRILAILTPPPS
jgi:hypothetical protein